MFAGYPKPVAKVVTVPEAVILSIRFPKKFETYNVPDLSTCIPLGLLNEVVAPILVAVVANCLHAGAGAGTGGKVGAGVGIVEGYGLGSGVGFVVGVGDGIVVGSALGSGVGFVVGFGDGLGVGAAVGSRLA